MKRIISLLILWLLVVPTSAQDFRTLNSSQPGEPFDVKQYLRRGKTYIAVFRSAHSKDCLRLERALKDLSGKRRDLEVVLVDVDRKGSADIDWSSPLVRQYNLRALPYVYLIDDEGKTTSQGHSARKEILRMLESTKNARE